MRAIDANVLARLLARDDAAQVKAAETFIETGAWVSQLVLMEAIWVLDAVYEVPAEKIADGIEQLLEHKQLVLQDGEVIAAAVAQFRKRPNLGFSDCLTLEAARKAGHFPVGTFDRNLAKLDGAERL